jgi:DNA gyrase subunit B
MSDYGSASIKVLKGLEAVRERPGMYIGETNEHGMVHMVKEIVDNSIDEAMAGHCSEITVTIGKDGFASVLDNGRGIPVDIHPEEGISSATLALTVLHAGGKFENGKDGSGYKTSGGLHGVGSSVVNALSTRLDMEIYRQGYTWNQSFEKGVPVTDLIKGAKTDRTGTKISFNIDFSIFKDYEDENRVLEWDVDKIKSILSSSAHLNPGLSITFIDATGDESVTHHWCAESFADILNVISPNKSVPIVGPIVASDIVDTKNNEKVVVDIAFQVHEERAGEVCSYANNVITPQGGTHDAGFRSALLRAFNAYGEANNIIKERLTAEDVKEGLIAAISVKITDPRFANQTKDKLLNTECNGAVSTVTYQTLTRFFEENPKEAKSVILRAVNAQKARAAAEKARQLVERKTPLSVGSLPGKLADCQSADPAECELYIVEGDSAGGSAKQGRDRRTQAILPLKGKPLNVQKMDNVAKALKSEEIQNIIKVLGCGVLNSFDIEKLKYHKIIIMTDADVDGEHIITLLLTLFNKYMPGLIEGGYIYIANPPLYRLKKGNAEPVWIQNDEELDAFFAENDKSKYEVQRFKGLGEMNPEQLWNTTMNPETRSLSVVAYEDDTAMNDEAVFELLMGSDVPPRREFIEENAIYADIDV